MNALTAVTKNSCQYQLYMLPTKETHKSFIGFFELDEGVTGESIAAIVETALAECHLDPSKMRGQAYDGISNMSGKYKHSAAIIQ